MRNHSNKKEEVRRIEVNECILLNIYPDNFEEGDISPK
jgi:hypothetical protein